VNLFFSYPLVPRVADCWAKRDWPTGHSPLLPSSSPCK
jgi:hypothetical protein